MGLVPQAWCGLGFGGWLRYFKKHMMQGKGCTLAATYSENVQRDILLAALSLAPHSRNRPLFGKTKSVLPQVWMDGWGTSRSTLSKADAAHWQPDAPQFSARSAASSLATPQHVRHKELLDWSVFCVTVTCRWFGCQCAASALHHVLLEVPHPRIQT